MVSFGFIIVTTLHNGDDKDNDNGDDDDDNNNNNPIDQSSWTDTTASASKDILHIWRNPNVHYRADNSPPIVSTLSQSKPIHAIPLCVFDNHFNIILQSMSACFNRYRSFGFPHQNPLHYSSPPRVPHATPIPIS